MSAAKPTRAPRHASTRQTGARLRAGRAKVNQNMDDLDLMACRSRRFSPNKTTQAHELRLNNRVAAGYCFLLGAGLLATVLLAGAAQALSPGEAQQLKTTLTPMGAERSGNRDG